MTIPGSLYLLAQALGWAVVHSIWQIALIWVVFKTLSWVLRGRNQAIYLLSLASMLASTLWFSATFVWEHAQISQAAQAEAFLEQQPVSAIFPGGDPAIVATAIAAPTLVETLANWLESHAMQIGWAWSICVLLLWLRLLGGWYMVQRLKHRDVVSPGKAFAVQCAALTKKLKINLLVQLLESPHVHEPLTLGFWKPVILFPAGMLLSLSPAQVEALLLHELAHIRRNDYLINLVQLTLETCFFYHPLFWLMSRDARARREFCCDDVVLLHTGDPIMYAKTLTELQLSLLHPITQFTMNATGKSRFTERILRIAGISPSRESRPNWLIVLLLPIIIAICSWWPSQAAPLPLEISTIDDRIALSDTVPPRKSARPMPNATLPPAPGKAATTNDNLNSTVPAAEPRAPKVAIEVVKMNVFYIGVDNPVRVAVEGIPANELILRLDGGNGTIIGGDGNYTVRVNQPGEATISILHLENGVETEISAQKYRVKRIPDPTPSLRTDGSDRVSGGLITKEKLLEAKSIEAIMTNFDFDGGCQVTGYEITILPKGGDAITWYAVGSNIPQNAREFMQKLGGDGDAIFFDDIKVQCPGDLAVRNIGNISYKLSPKASGE